MNWLSGQPVTGSQLRLLVGSVLIAGVLWSPVLLSGRFRSLFRQLPPTDSVFLSYLAVSGGLSLPYVLGTSLVLMREPQAAASKAILDTVVQVTFVYVVGLPLIAGDGLPKLGVDWDSTGYGGTTWLLLVGGVVWYVLLFLLPLGFLAVLVAIPN